MSYTYTEKKGVPEPGWSDRMEDPEILAGLEKNRRAAFRWGCAGVLLALAIPPLVSKFVENSIPFDDSFKVGGAIAGIMLICMLFSRLSKSAKNAYEGTVIEKREELRRESGDRKNGGSSYRTEYVTYVKTTDGRKKKIKESHKYAYSAWEYLKVGDKFRYHPQLAVPYEVYDKSKVQELFCPVCAKKNPVESDRCSRCHAPLMK